MLIPVGYDRFRAVAYALRWALSRNPRYYDFEDIGGDCTNYVSQCLFAGCGVMNYAPENGWYYINPDDRAPSWTSVELLRRFLLNNGGGRSLRRQRGSVGAESRRRYTAPER